MVCYQNFYWAYVDDGGGGSGGGGEGGSGEGSGGGGGGGNGGTPPDCNGPGGGINPNRTANVNPCEPGWEPIEDIPEDPPLQDTLINSCVQANVVASDPQFKAMLQDL